jgi:hypothetical protein
MCFNPSDGHAGVAKFKRSFGCQAYESHVLIHKSILTMEKRISEIADRLERTSSK